ncbi:hypothetical protein SEA_GALACTICA_104 [Streptomyces phage Galactica]|nr:hypothetical protein SEA_GALACTICA_104 [Streptomyces phage Galactica]
MNATATRNAAKVACACSLVRIFAEDGTLITTGCVATTRRTFAPGHDARLKGFLIRAGIAGHTVRLGADGEERDAQAVANQFGFGYMVAEGIRKGAEREFKKELRRVAKDAKKTHETPKQVAAKVGRWTYEGVITDSPEHGPQFTYTNRKGVQVTTTKFTRV